MIERELQVARESRRKFLSGCAVTSMMGLRPTFVIAGLLQQEGACVPLGPEKGPFLFIAHHGSGKVYPENTIEACRWAVRHEGANALEIDICFSSDGQAFLWHDWDPNEAQSIARQLGWQPDTLYKPRVPPIFSEWRKPIDQLTLAEVRAHYGYCKLATNHHTEGTPPPAKDALPRLEEFLGWARTESMLRCVFLDIKMPDYDAARAPAMLDAIHAALSAVGAVTFDIVLMVPHEEVLDALIRHNRAKKYCMTFTWDIEFPVGIIFRPDKFSAIDHAIKKDLDAASIGRPTPLTGDAWDVYQEVIRYDVSRWQEVNANPAYQNAKIEMLVAWTINASDEMAFLIQKGVTGIITDDIPCLKKVLARSEPLSVPSTTTSAT